MPAASDKPNVLLICTDHLSGLAMRPGGHPVVMTPTLEQLARSGVNYTQAYSACPCCIPARKTLMTGLTARGHGERVYVDGSPMPEATTLAQCFREGGYQSYAVGKMHVYPQRDRIGFDEVLMEDQGRHQFDSGADDWELYLADQGYAGQEYASGMTQNDWVARPWHLPEHCHPINWAAREMSRAIRRRDPRKPGFWYLSFSAPHPPLTPLQAYLDLYRDIEIDRPTQGNWSDDFDSVPFPVRKKTANSALMGASWHEQELARRAFYATVTHVDHQIRTVLGTLREEGLLNNTAIVFTSDHGHMVGEHGLWCMTPFYEMSAKIPLILVPPAGDKRVGMSVCDDRLAEFGDIMPTLLDLAGLPIPEGVETVSLIGEGRRDHLYGELGEGPLAMRMIREGRFKLIYYPAGNRSQLFDIEADPRESADLAADPGHADDLKRLQGLLEKELYGGDEDWKRNGEWVGVPEPKFKRGDCRHIGGQRGHRFM